MPFLGGYTVVKDYVWIARTRSREVFVPLAHPPGPAQVDFGECIGVIGGVRMKLHVFCFDLSQSDACFIKAYPGETTEAFLDGHVSAFAFFGGIPLSILYDNLKIAVARILRDGKRQRIRAFTELNIISLIAPSEPTRSLGSAAGPPWPADAPATTRELLVTNPQRHHATRHDRCETKRLPILPNTAKSVAEIGAKETRSGEDSSKRLRLGRLSLGLIRAYALFPSS